MIFRFLCHTDIGNTREKNEDSLVVKSGSFGGVAILLAAICDGVGGLEGGETASYTAVSMISEWFDEELPVLEPEVRILKKRLESLAESINSRIRYENERAGKKSGTTCSALLLWKRYYLICHIGDSRIYMVDEKVYQLTEDHSWLAEEVRKGRMTAEEAERDIRKNRILKCFGAGQTAAPDLLAGEVRDPSSFVLCTDGFWHRITGEELKEKLGPGFSKDTAVLEKLTNLVKDRGEDDNISVIAVDVTAGDNEEKTCLI